jgi:sigma-54 specific flagellar transcriptional regulator A
MSADSVISHLRSGSSADEMARSVRGHGTTLRLTDHADSQAKLLYRGLVGESRAIRRLRELILKIAPSRSNILINGETGTGKEIVARNIHFHSRQSRGRFVPVNCAAIPPDLLESELFGHKRGAFTGATTDRDGRFTFAADGTLFLDEIGDMSPALQVKLLRVLEERVIYRVGCNEPIPMTARLVAATHRDLERSVEDGAFREDLYYRLNVVPVSVPALRERLEDLSLLAAELGHRLKREEGLSISLTPAAVERLQRHDWPGNVRELANLIERLAVIHPDGTADVADLPGKYREPAAGGARNEPLTDTAPMFDFSAPRLTDNGINLKDYLKTTEAALIRQALDRSDGVVAQAASLLQIGRTTLSEKVKRLGLSDFVNASG